MRWSQALIPTLKEDPKEAQSPSHRLLLRAGFVRQHQAGVYIFLPLGQRVLHRIMRIVREEMNRIGAQEVLMPSLTARELWEESGRWKAFGPDMFRLQDRKGRQMALAPTHEELFADLARHYLRSYRDLPQIWYQIQTKFRDEPRPRSGILRVREFLMKDSYSFDASWEGLDHSYQLHHEAYTRIFTRAGLRFVVTRASTGLMGGSASEEFMVPSEAGEDTLALCDQCGYSANVEVATGTPALPKPTSPFQRLEKVHTPGVKTVEEVTAFLGVGPELLIKSLVYMVGDRAVLVLVRGDYEVNEAKLQQVLGGEVRIATPEEVQDRFGVEVGFVGPVNLEVDEIIADETLRGLQGMVCGANESDHHLVGVNVEEHFPVHRYADVREVKAGDRCPQCGAPLRLQRAIEVGHIFKLGTRYSEALGAYFTDRDGQEKPIIMGSYGIGIGRVMAAAVELYHDQHGIVWPVTIAPYDVEILALDPRKVGDVAERAYHDLQAAGLEVLWDDRDLSPGVKFKDADLVGIPLHVVLGRKVAQGLAEIKIRATGASVDVPLPDLQTRVQQMLESLKGEINERLGKTA